MALASAVPITVTQEFLDGTIKAIVEEIQSQSGLTIDEAKDFVANIVVDLMLNAIILGGIMKTKAAIKTAEYLGFTTKGWAKRTLSKQAAAAAKIIDGPWEKFKAYSLMSKLLVLGGVTGTGIWLTSAIANIIEPGIYKTQETNAVYRKLKIPFQYPTEPGQLQPGPFDSRQFKDLATALETQNIVAIKNPVTQATEIYNRNALADIINYIYGAEILSGNAPSVKQLSQKIAPYLIMPTGGLTPAAPTPAVSATTAAAAVSAPIRVFTGVISQGVLGNATSFTPRPDDLIQSVSELQTAAHNNLAPFIAALPGRIVYEIKIMSSITTKDGFTQRGTSQRIVSGYHKNGEPKYRTVINKFAVMNLFIKTDQNTKTKISSIVLGPTDAVKFQPVSNDLASVESAIRADISAPAVSSIQAINTPQGVATVATAVVPPTAAVTAAAPKPQANLIGRYLVARDGFDGNVYKVKNGKIYSIMPSDFLLTQAEKISAGNFGAQANAAIPKLKEYGINVETMERVQFFDTIVPGESGPTRSEPFEQFFNIAGSVTPAPAEATASPALAANTLYEYYTALGLTLPSVEERSKLYESLKLGQAAYYTGTAEQNAKLLTALQGK